MTAPAVDFWTADREADLHRLVGTGHTDPQVAAHFGVGRYAIEYARRRFKLQSMYQARKRGLPVDFLELAPTMTLADAERRWKAAPQTVRDWFKSNGITPAKRVYPGKPKPIRGYSRPADLPTPTLLPQREESLAGSAQLYLQHYGPVFRASVINPNAPGWVMFGRRVSEDDMIQTAYRKGFRQEAMAA